MNYFIEGLQGSGKSTLVQAISDDRPGFTAVREGEYSPVELAWCAYLGESEYREILDRYAAIRPLIEEKTYCEGEKRIVCYTKIRTDIPGFYADLEQHEIYNGRTSFAEFRSILLDRYQNWDTDRMIFECSLFQNTVEDMILFRCASDDEILDFYRAVRGALDNKAYRILYLKTQDIRENLRVIRKERADENGNELWYPLMLRFFDESPYAKRNNLQGEDALLDHFRRRQALEMRICETVFPDKYVVLESKNYTKADISKLFA